MLHPLVLLAKFACMLAEYQEEQRKEIFVFFCSPRERHHKTPTKPAARHVSLHGLDGVVPNNRSLVLESGAESRSSP